MAGELASSGKWTKECIHGGLLVGRGADHRDEAYVATDLDAAHAYLDYGATAIRIEECNTFVSCRRHESTFHSATPRWISVGHPELRRQQHFAKSSIDLAARRGSREEARQGGSGGGGGRIDEEERQGKAREGSWNGRLARTPDRLLQFPSRLLANYPIYRFPILLPSSESLFSQTFISRNFSYSRLRYYSFLELKI